MFLLLHSALPISEICNSVTKFASLDCVPGLSMFDTSSGLFRHFTTILHHQTMAVTWTWGLTVGDIWKYHHQTCKRCVTMESTILTGSVYYRISNHYTVGAIISRFCTLLSSIGYMSDYHHFIIAITDTGYEVSQKYFAWKMRYNIAAVLLSRSQ